MDGHHDIVVALLTCVGECASLIGVDLLGEVHHPYEHVAVLGGWEWLIRSAFSLDLDPRFFFLK